MARKVEELIGSLSEKSRVIILGGLAVIAHGLSRSTLDADIWMEPTDLPSWTTLLKNEVRRYPDAAPFDLRDQKIISFGEIEKTVTRDGVLRIVGLDQPLNVFLKPNNLELEDFDNIWKNSTLKIDNTKVPDEIDLIITKEDTSRPQDKSDITFLQEKLRKRYSKILETCEYEVGRNILDRYTDHVLCAAASRNRNAKLINLALGFLQEMADLGDPFAMEELNILENNKIPNDTNSSST